MVPSTSLVGAVFGAAAYGPGQPPTAPPALPVEALAAIRHALLELHCGHEAQVLADLRAARAHLCACAGPLPTDVLTALDEAAWFLRARAGTGPWRGSEGRAVANADADASGGAAPPRDGTGASRALERALAGLVQQSRRA